MLQELGAAAEEQADTDPADYTVAAVEPVVGIDPAAAVAETEPSDAAAVAAAVEEAGADSNLDWPAAALLQAADSAVVPQFASVVVPVAAVLAQGSR